MGIRMCNDVYRFEEKTTNNNNNKNNVKMNQGEDKIEECSKPLIEGYVQKAMKIIYIYKCRYLINLSVVDILIS